MHTRIVRKAVLVMTLILVSLLAIGPTMAQPYSELGTEAAPPAPEAITATYAIPWWTVDGGGTSASVGGGYSLGGTAGQPDTGPRASGGAYSLTGGFWFSKPATYRTIYFPTIGRRYH